MKHRKHIVILLLIASAALIAGCGGGGGSATPDDLGDTTAPVISTISAAPGASTVQVTWQTDEPATSLVEYGPTTGYGSLAQSAQMTTLHEVNITGLSPATTYHYRVTSADAAGNPTSSADRTFTTSAFQPVASYPVSILRPDRSYSLDFTYSGGAYYKAGTAPDWNTTVTFFGRAFSTSGSDPHIAIRLGDFFIIPTSYALSPGGTNYVQLSIYASAGDHMDRYVSRSGNITISQVGNSGRNWKGSFDCEAVCSSTGKTLKASGTFDLPQTTSALPVSL